jgi:hypothetical protein
VAAAICRRAARGGSGAPLGGRGQDLRTCARVACAAHRPLLHCLSFDGNADSVLARVEAQLAQQGARPQSGCDARSSFKPTPASSRSAPAWPKRSWTPVTTLAETDVRAARLTGARATGLGCGRRLRTRPTDARDFVLAARPALEARRPLQRALGLIRRHLEAAPAPEQQRNRLRHILTSPARKPPGVRIGVCADSYDAVRGAVVQRAPRL